VSWWPGAVDGRDIVGLNYGGLHGDAVAGASAMVGGGFSLDGAGDYLEVPNDASLNLRQAITLIAWVNVPSFNPLEPTQNVIGKGNFGGNGDEAYALVINQDRTAAIQLNHGRYPGRIDLNRAEVSTGGTGRLNAGQWHLIAGTYDLASGELKMFLDGVVKGFILGLSDFQVMGGLVVTSQPLLIGKTNRAGSPYPTSTYLGMIDEPQVYNRALTDAEVLAIYEAGPAGLCLPSNEGQPTARIAAPAAWSEGDVVQFDGTGSSTDPAGGSLTFAWDFGDGSTGTGPTPTHVYGDDGPYSVTLTVTTPSALQGTTSTVISGANVEPQVGAVAAPYSPQAVNSVVALKLPFSDPGFLDTHSATINWDANGSGTDVAATMNVGEVTGSHAYTSAGVYTVRVTVIDDDGGDATAEFRYVVVYDPEDGFVTGGGWFHSPAGAYTANPDLTGKAHFAFVSRYKKGAHVPSGNTEFQFSAAGLHFKSTAYEWLVVAGQKAQFKGTGQVNGAGTFTFMLSAIDATPDRVRIRIWDNGGTVYDNHMNAPDDANPSTTLGGGAIVIHRN
jgi:PKD repeat protein